MTEAETDDAWIGALFGVLRDEVISISADFAPRVKRRIDLVADALTMYPPSATALLTSVSLETTNMVVGAIRSASSDDEPDPTPEES